MRSAKKSVFDMMGIYAKKSVAETGSAKKIVRSNRQDGNSLDSKEGRLPFSKCYFIEVPMKSAIFDHIEVLSCLRGVANF